MSSHPDFDTSDEVEAAFYGAFTQCDSEAMASVWANEKVVCIHPGSNPIYGLDAVMRSWDAILNQASTPDILFNVIKKTVNNNLAIHIVEEHIAHGKSVAVVLATNVYQQFDNGWLMIEHHASVIHPQDDGRTLQ